MLTEDYIMRLISQALAVVTAALGLKRKRKYSEALLSFDQAKEILIGLDAHMVDQLDEAAIIDRLTTREKLDVERTGLLADIYAEQGELYALSGQTVNSDFAYQRSLRLYLETALASEDVISVEIIQKIEALRNKLTASKYSGETCLAMLDYLERLLGSKSEFLVSAGLSRTKLQADLTLFTSKCDS